MNRRRGILASVLVVAALVLSACTGLPVSGPVNPGLAAGEDAGSPEFLFRPDEPQPGATPEQIVEGFIRAGSGPGPAANWEVARMFLAPSIRETWKPEASVTIDLPDDREPVSPSEGAVELSLVAVATVDQNGAYQPDAGITQLSFRLAQQDDGEWRITEAPDGVVIDRDVFANVFHRYSLMYFDPTWQFLVPDVRWFPTTNAATRIADALVDGAPSGWLAESVRNSFPESVSLARPSVPLESGVAQVTLSAEALLVESTTLDRMQTQLSASLATAGVSGAQMSVASTPLTAETVSTRSTRVTGPPLVLTEEGFGFLSGDELTPVPGLSDAMDLVEPLAIQVAPDRDFAAVRLVGDAVARVPSDGDIAVIDSRPGLVDPSADPFGYIWSVPRDRPTEIAVFSADGVQSAVADAWPGATQVLAMSVSRDGTRLAALLVSGGRSEVWIAGIVRGADNVPERLGDPVPLGPLVGTGSGLAWLDDTTLGLLSSEAGGPLFTQQLIGGPATATDAPQGAASVAGATSISTVRLRTDDGSLYVKRGANWQRTTSGILILATQQGSPQ
ncbi:Lipoprotein LpqB beta-propeller domain-containing protein [Microbacterium sp. cf046]|uniref:LpqB family beta-propeller domain-containing protein n=1 Tax=Microbacterium sp. cf046 TaxID=1761803 RepID=UPI0008EE6CFA|nr:LpqB family beta-propeller domain-containing protein [Microbacterium sp. cf046]SFR99430.1 Lipoprotein LpqB beta-propeller domain-containing protein [Microbacterium sp. cf046]